MSPSGRQHLVKPIAAQKRFNGKEAITAAVASEHECCSEIFMCTSLWHYGFTPIAKHSSYAQPRVVEHYQGDA